MWSPLSKFQLGHMGHMGSKNPLFINCSDDKFEISHGLPRWTATAVLTTSLLGMSVVISKLVNIWCICEFWLKGCHFGIASLRWFLEQFLGLFILDKHHLLNSHVFYIFKPTKIYGFCASLVFTFIADTLSLKTWSRTEKNCRSQLLKIMNVPEFKSSFLSQNWHNGVPKIKSKSIFFWWQIRVLDSLGHTVWVIPGVNYVFQWLFWPFLTRIIYVFKSETYTKCTLNKRVI